MLAKNYKKKLVFKFTELKNSVNKTKFEIKK